MFYIATFSTPYLSWYNLDVREPVIYSIEDLPTGAWRTVLFEPMTGVIGGFLVTPGVGQPFRTIPMDLGCRHRCVVRRGTLYYKAWNECSRMWCKR
jgi:hypothetical protein